MTRYIGILSGEWVSLYNFSMKIFFIGSSCYILYLMKSRYRCVSYFHSFLRLSPPDIPSSETTLESQHADPHLLSCSYRPTNDPSIDTFRIEYLLGPSAVLALIFNYSFAPTEILWSFSIFLESVAILPQLFMLQRTGEAETITTHYLAALGAYRGLYLPNWIYR